MIDIFLNFCKLKKSNDIDILYKKLKLENKTKFTSDILENMIHYRILEDEELETLDKFIKKTLRLFPQLFPYIILNKKQSNSNLEKERKVFNNRKQIIVETKITKNRPANEIVNAYQEKMYPLSMNSDDFLNDIDKDITFKDVEDEILIIIQQKFKNQFNNEELKKFAKIITAEIYLRTLSSHKHTHTKDFKQFSDTYNNAINLYDLDIIKKVAINIESNKENLLSLLKQEFLK